jgi:hypothetical protein
MSWKPMPKRTLTAALKRQHCVKVSEQGKHEKWRCGCEQQHTTAVPRHNQISPTVLKNIISDLKCLPEGWLK